MVELACYEEATVVLIKSRLVIKEDPCNRTAQGKVILVWQRP